MAQRLVRILLLAALTVPWLVLSPVVAEEKNAVGAAIAFLAPSDPLDSGVGLALHYRRSLAPKLALAADLSFIPIDRQAEGVALAGSADVIDLGVGVLWRLTEGAWPLAVGGGIDWLAPSGDGDYDSGSPTSITNDYDVDAGVGFHAMLEVSHAVGSRWRLFGRAGWLAADLDGEQHFVIDGVVGAPYDVSFDFSGPQLQIGGAWSF